MAFISSEPQLNKLNKAMTILYSKPYIDFFNPIQSKKKISVLNFIIKDLHLFLTIFPYLQSDLNHTVQIMCKTGNTIFKD